MPTEAKSETFAAIKVTMDVPVDRVRNLITGALEGGSNNWVNRIKSFNYGPHTADDFKEGGKLNPKADFSFFGRKELVPTTPGCSMTLRVDNPNEGPDHIDVVIDPEKIKVGLQVMAEKYAGHFGDFMNEHDDATTGDVFLQCVCFGEVCFG